MNKTLTTIVLLIFVVPYIFRNQLAKATSLGLQKGFVWILMFGSTTCFPAATTCNLQLWGQQSASFVLEYQLVPINQCFIFFLGKLHGFTKMLFTKTPDLSKHTNPNLSYIQNTLFVVCDRFKYYVYESLFSAELLKGFS